MSASSSSFWRNGLRRLGQMGNHEALGKLGDFTTTPRMLLISGLALIIGIISGFVALILLKLIGLFTNLFFYQRWNTALSSPSGNHLGLAVIIIPVIGALIVGFMARYGSERIRGHGIPEAIEAILINGSKMKPWVALLKPVSSAIVSCLRPMVNEVVTSDCPYRPGPTFTPYSSAATVTLVPGWK